MLAEVATWLNVIANAAGKALLAPVALTPGWLSATAIAALTGLLLLIVFKYTSNQRAIQRTRDDISAHLLALKLFKENAWVTLRAQGRILLGAFRLLTLALVSMLVMVVPVTLLWGQMALWYQSRPLGVGEEAVMTVGLSGGLDVPWPDVRLRPSDAAEVTAGPVRVLSKREVCWSLRARQSGYHRLVLEVEGQLCDKELAVGDGYMRVSARRPGWGWSSILRHPSEPPFRPDSPVRSVEIEYPPRHSWTSGTDQWMLYWLAASLVAALGLRPWLNVRI